MKGRHRVQKGGEVPRHPGWTRTRAGESLREDVVLGNGRIVFPDDHSQDWQIGDAFPEPQIKSWLLAWYFGLRPIGTILC